MARVDTILSTTPRNKCIVAVSGNMAAWERIS
jgi:hypothetical protein